MRASAAEMAPVITWMTLGPDMLVLIKMKKVGVLEGRGSKALRVERRGCEVCRFRAQVNDIRIKGVFRRCGSCLDATELS